MRWDHPGKQKALTPCGQWPSSCNPYGYYFQIIWANYATKAFNCVKPSLDPLQFAYLPKRSTEDAISTVLHEATQHLDKPSAYARCLFIDYSSAFNTIQPHILIGKLAKLNVPARLQLWVLDFLTRRQQRVRSHLETSTYLEINTGAPQGCVLSALLFSIYTNDLTMNSQCCKIMKYADDMVVMGLICNNDESEYRNVVEYVNTWCIRNYLDLNVAKTKEIIYDFRKHKVAHTPVVIKDDVVDVVTNFKYLGVSLQDDMRWSSHIAVQVKKCNKRLYHVRCLHKLNVDSKIICMFYNCVVSIVLFYAISCWYNSCTEHQKSAILKIRKRCSRIISPLWRDKLEHPRDIYLKRCLAFAKKVMDDQHHPLHQYFVLLPSGRRYASARCRTTRFRNMTIPTCIRLINDSL